MNPKIDSVIMGPNGHRAAVSGPINWDDDEESATFSAAIAQMQSGQLVMSSGQNMHVFTKETDERWNSEVQTLNSERLVLGTAVGWATAAVLDQSGSWECYPWEVAQGLQVTGGPVVVSALSPHPDMAPRLN